MTCSGHDKRTCINQQANKRRILVKNLRGFCTKNGSSVKRTGSGQKSLSKNDKTPPSPLLRKHSSLGRRRDLVKHRLNLSDSPSPPRNPDILTATDCYVYATPTGGSSTKTVPDSFNQAPSNKEYKLKVFGSACEGGTNFNFHLKEGTVLPFYTETTTKKGIGKIQKFT